LWCNNTLRCYALTAVPITDAFWDFVQCSSSSKRRFGGRIVSISIETQQQGTKSQKATTIDTAVKASQRTVFFDRNVYPCTERPLCNLTGQQAIAKTPVKRSAYQINSLILVLGYSLLVPFSRATIGLVVTRYRGALLSTLLHLSLTPISYNKASAYQLQRSATEHSSTCKSHSHKPQQAQCLSVTEERY
jgi:hypothetical protein